MEDFKDLKIKRTFILMLSFWLLILFGCIMVSVFLNPSTLTMAIWFPIIAAQQKLNIMKVKSVQRATLSKNETQI